MIKFTDTSLTVWITLSAHEVCFISWYNPSKVTFCQALFTLQEPLFAFDIACVTVQWTGIAALTWSFAWLAAMCFSILVEAKGTLRQTQLTMKIWPNTIWITLCAVIAIIIITFEAVFVAFYTPVPTCIVVSCWWASRIAFLLEYEVESCQSIAANTIFWLVLNTSFTWNITFELQAESLFSAFNEKVI